MIISAIIFFLGYHGLNILIANWNVNTVIDRMAKGNRRQIEHFWYGLGYLIICLPMYCIANIWFVLAVIPLSAQIVLL